MSLPSGYKRLEYIQSSGTQYIDTKVKPTVNTKFSFGVYMLEQTGDCIIGNFLHDYNDYRIFNYSGSIYWDFKDSRIIGTAGSFPENTYFEFECGNNYVKKNGQQVLTGQNISAFTADANIFAFTNGASARCSGRLYFLKIFDGESLIRDFIPCQKPDGTIGLWDNANSVFYGNAGTGTFEAGPVLAIAADKSEITKLEYIKSSGTQYVDAGFKPTGDTKVVIDFQMVSQGSAQQGVFGSRTGASGRFTVFTGDSTGALQVDYGTYGTLATETNTISGLNLNNRNTIEVNNSLIINGNTVKTVSVVSFTSTYNLFLFANNNAGTAQLPGAMKLYSCQIYDNGTMIRDYIAAKLADGTVGLYDKLNGLFYINAGTGTFEAGPVVASPSIFVNIDGIWKPINNIYVNINNIWQKST